jgi:phytoene/squalene synthetase
VSNDDLNACADLVRRGDPERFLAAMAAPVEARKVLFPIYAFNVEVARAPWVTNEPMIAEMRLQWWRDALAEIREGGTIRRHEVVTPLAGLLDAEGADLLDQLIEARRWDINRDPFEDAAHFNRYLEHTAGHLMLVAARALGPVDAAIIRDAGYAHGLAGWLRAVPALERANRVPLIDGRAAAVKALAGEGLARLKHARGMRGSVSAAVRPALLPLWQTATILKRAWRDPARVAEGRLDSAPALSRLHLMARAATGFW